MTLADGVVVVIREFQYAIPVWVVGLEWLGVAVLVWRLMTWNVRRWRARQSTPKLPRE